MLPDTAKERLSAGARAEDKLDLTDERSLAFDESAFAALLQAVEYIRDHSDKHLPQAWKSLAILDSTILNNLKLPAKNRKRKVMQAVCRRDQKSEFNADRV